MLNNNVTGQEMSLAEEINELTQSENTESGFKMIIQEINLRTINFLSLVFGLGSLFTLIRAEHHSG